MIGQTVSHYRIIDKLGEGGMGVVYLAEDKHLARRVAIKFLSSTDHHYRARFIREARAVSALNHPNIATVHDYGETAEGMPFIVMELVNGQDLKNLLEGSGITLIRSVEIVSAIAEALKEAHLHGIVHRDIKPKGTNKCRMSCVPPWNQCSRWKSTSQLAQARSSLAETFRAFHSPVSRLLRLRRQALG